MCPQCTGTDIEDDMAKITLSGPSNQAAEDEGAESSAGTNSSTPTDSPQTETSEETSSKRKSAPTTESRSKKAGTASFSARSTDTGPKGK